MTKDNDTAAIAEALEKLTERLDDAVGSGRRSRRDADGDADEPRGVRGLRRGGGSSSAEVQAVLFQVRVPVGRGETMPVHLQFAAVRDERELADLAEEVRRNFRDAVVYQPKRDFGGSNYSRYGGGNGYGYGRGGYDRGGRY